MQELQVARWSQAKIFQGSFGGNGQRNWRPFQSIERALQAIQEIAQAWRAKLPNQDILWIITGVVIIHDERRSRLMERLEEIDSTRDISGCAQRFRIPGQSVVSHHCP